MKNETVAIAAIFANNVDGQLVREYFAGLGYDLADFPNDEHHRVDLFILDKPSARRIGRKIVELKRAAEVFLPVLLILDPEEVVSPWLDAGFDVCLKQPLSKDELRAVTELLLRTRQQSQTLERRGETKCRTIFENTGTATMLMKEDFTILMANKECFSLTGYSPDRLVGTKLIDYVAPECDEPLLAHSAATRGGSKKAPDRYETKLINKAGQVRDVYVRVGVMPESNQRIVSMMDITERLQAERALQESEKRYRAVVDQAGDEIYLHDDQGRFLDVNEKALEHLGYTKKELLSKAVVDIDPLAIQRGMDTLWADVLDGNTFIFDGYHQKKNGDRYPVEITIGPVYLERQTLIVAVCRDITKRLEREAQIQSLSTVVEQSVDGMAIADLEGRITFANRAWADIHGFDEPDALIGRHLSIFHSQEQLENDVIPFNKEVLEKGFNRGEVGHIRKDGTIVYTMMTTTLLRDQEGAPVAIAGVVTDITAARQTQRQLAESLALYQTLVESSADHIFMLDDQGTYLTTNRKFWRDGQSDHAPAVGRNVADTHDADTAEQYMARVKDVFDTGESVRFEHKARMGDQVRWHLDTLYPIRRAGRVWAVGGICRDITERKLTEDALLQREALFSSLFHSHTAVQLLVDPDTGQIIDANRAATVFYGRTQEQLSQMKISELSVFSPEEIKRRIQLVISGKQRYFESRHKIADGSVRDVEVYGSTVEADSHLLFCVIIQDITARKQAEAQKQKLEEQLYQTQKLESVGRLAGGVAHDFNNMLSVILGFGEEVFDQLHQDDPLRDDVKEILEAGKRSAALTRQLLAFSRKQTLRPEVVQLGAIVRNLEKMLGRLIGEKIELHLVLSEENDYVLADPGQIEQVIMNLAVNSRDAMPDGGKLIIETANADLDEKYVSVHPRAMPGRYALLSVTDTGCGIDKETLSQIFEPFFTTKEKGQGTGLGLSTVYGIVKQSNGSIWAYSEPGHGTTIKIYLPLTEKKPVKEQESTVPELPTGGEHILVVEDEESLRKLVGTILSRLGYQVSVAANGGEALLLFEKEGLKPDLVITDMVMPKMSGKELVERLRKMQPDLKVLYMSGYTDNAIAHHEILDPATPFIQKPFTMRDIADKIQHILWGGRGNEG